MNAKEGLRRLGLATGVLGLVLGLYMSYNQLHELLYQRGEAKEFQSLISSRIVRREVRFLKNDLRNSKDPEFKSHHHGQDWFDAVLAISGSLEGWEIDEGSVKKMYFTKNEDIKAIEKGSGEMIQYASQPTLWSYVVTLLPPVLGFVLPWGTLMALTWIGSGFFSK